MNYFDELQQRIRNIRLSEKFFIKKSKTSTPPVLNYNPKAKKPARFFQNRTNKLLWAIGQQTRRRAGLSPCRCQPAPDGHVVKGNVDRKRSTITGDDTDHTCFCFMSKTSNLFPEIPYSKILHCLHPTPLFFV